MVPSSDSLPLPNSEWPMLSNHLWTPVTAPFAVSRGLVTSPLAVLNGPLAAFLKASPYAFVSFSSSMCSIALSSLRRIISMSVPSTVRGPYGVVRL